MAAHTSKVVELAVHAIEQLTHKTGDFLSSDKSRDKELTNSLKTLYDSSKCLTDTENNLNSLPELIVTGFDEEQIWQQIELDNESNISSLLKQCSQIISKKSSLSFKNSESAKSRKKDSKQPVLKEHSQGNVKKKKVSQKTGKKKATTKPDENANVESSNVDEELEHDSDEDISALEERYKSQASEEEEDDKFFDFTGDSDDDLNFDFGPLGQNADSDEEIFNGDNESDDELGNEDQKRKKKSVTFKDNENETPEKRNKTLGKKTKSLLKKSQKPGSIVDDKFFKLSELEEFLDQEDRKEARRLKRENTGQDFNDEDDDLDENEADDIDLFAEIESDEEDCHYNDFFDPPENDPGDVDDDEDFDPSNDNEDVDYDDDEDVEEEQNDDDEPEARSSKNTRPGRYDLLADSDSEGEDVQDILGHKREQKSSFEVRQEKLKQKMSAIEEEMLAEKPWQLTGEINAAKRPENSLLQERLQFEQTTRLPPEITEETTKTLEQLIRQRIKDKAWDDVERKVKPKENPFEYKKRITLDQEKSKMSLGEIYEQEYLKQQQAEEVERKDPDHEDIKKELQSLFIKLDALSNFHYTPKQSTAELVVVTNQPSITMEEVAPVSVSDSKTLAPEEIKNKINDEVKGDSEKSKVDKRRERKKKKKAQRIREKEKQQREKIVEKLNPGLGNKYSKEKAMNQLEKASKAGKPGVTMLKDEGKRKSDLTSSKAFFTQLQEEVVTNIHRKKGNKRKDNSHATSVKKLKL